MGSLDFYSLSLIFVFLAGYTFIAIEHVVRIDKATVALLTGVLCWTILFASPTVICENPTSCLNEHVSYISQIVLFLMGALAIVELISLHKGFRLISNIIQIGSKKSFLWIMSFLTFFLSAVLDNLTTTIVMISLLQKLLPKDEDRLLIGGAVVIAANAGGAWTPIGDVTTTMLWIGGQVSTLSIMSHLFAPSIVSCVASVFILSYMLKENNIPQIPDREQSTEPMGSAIFFLGLGALIFVPIFKILTGMPPFMGVFLGLSILWIFSDIAHKDQQDRAHLRMTQVFARLELSSLLFFLGILLAIAALDSAGLLIQLANVLNAYIGNDVIIATVIGLASAVVDNVPLVAGTMGMYTLEQYPPDHSFWQLIAFCAGTGGSILIIGSAAGVMFMGLEKVDFFWYVRRISLAAIAGYFAGIAVYLLF